MKSIQKAKLIGESQLERAWREPSIHSQLSNDNIVKLFEYTESEEAIIMYMEYVKDGNYFHRKVEEEKTPIKN